MVMCSGSSHGAIRRVKSSNLVITELHAFVTKENFQPVDIVNNLLLLIFTLQNGARIRFKL